MYGLITSSITKMHNVQPLYVDYARLLYVAYAGILGIVSHCRRIVDPSRLLFSYCILYSRTINCPPVAQIYL